MRKVAIAAAAIAISVIACFPQGQCESPPVEYCAAGDPNCKGQIINATTWISGPVDGAWLSYGPEQQFLMHLRDGVTGQVLSGNPDTMVLSGFVDALETPDASTGILPVPCAAELCDFVPVDTSSFLVKNNTCSTEFFRAIVTIVPFPSAADAGADALTADAGAD